MAIANAQGPRRSGPRRQGQLRPEGTEGARAMPPQRSTPADGAMPDFGELRAAPSRCDRQPAAPGDLTAMTMWLAQDRDRVAIGLNDAVVRRLFTAGLTLESALALMDNHPAAGKIRSSITELDLAIREIRQVIFDCHGTAPPFGWEPG